MRRKVPGINPLIKPKVFPQSTQIQRPILPYQNLQIPNTKRVSHSTSVERKQILPSLSHRPKVKPRSEVNPREVNKQDIYYSPQQTSPIYHSPQPHHFSDRQMFDPPQTVS